MIALRNEKAEAFGPPTASTEFPPAAVMVLFWNVLALVRVKPTAAALAAASAAFVVAIPACVVAVLEAVEAMDAELAAAAALAAASDAAAPPQLASP